MLGNWSHYTRRPRVSSRTIYNRFLLIISFCYELAFYIFLLTFQYFFLFLSFVNCSGFGLYNFQRCVCYLLVSTHVIHAWSNRRVPDGRQLVVVEIISDSRLRWNPNTVHQNVHSRFQALHRRRIPFCRKHMNILSEY